MNVLNPLGLDFWAAVGVAVLCGLIIGLERQLKGKPAGIRTSILICLGTAIFVQFALILSGPNTDPTRIIGQVITGIGFLGAGVIMNKAGIVVGITSASVIWILAAVGTAIGLGYYLAAIALSFLVVFILISVEYLESQFIALKQGFYQKRRGTDETKERQKSE